MKLIGYIRVSTKKQVDEGVSLEAQKKMLKGYTGLYGHELVKIIVDAGESAKSLSRKGVQEVIESLKNNEAEGVLITKLDRLVRSRKDFFELMDKYFYKDFSLLTVSGQIETKSANGRLTVNMMADIAQWEREIIAERTRAAMQHKKSKGEYTGGCVPYGFDLHADGVRLVRNETEQETLEKMKTLRSSEYSYRKISKILVRQGRLARTGKPFNPNSIRQMVA